VIVPLHLARCSVAFAFIGERLRFSSERLFQYSSERTLALPCTQQERSSGPKRRRTSGSNDARRDNRHRCRRPSKFHQRHVLLTLLAEKITRNWVAGFQKKFYQQNRGCSFYSPDSDRPRTLRPISRRLFGCGRRSHACALPPVAQSAAAGLLGFF
jgi:hypothetical protein